MTLRRICAVLVAATTMACGRQERENLGAIPVTSEVAKRSTFTPTLILLGVVRAERSTPLVSVAGGTVRYPGRFASGLQTGARVARGEVIVEVRNDQVISAQTQSRMQMEAAAADYERARRSFEQGVMSGAEHSTYEVRARLAKEAYNSSMRESSRQRIASPESGTLVVTKAVSPGSFVAPGTVFAEITSTGPAIVESAVPAADREQVQPGLDARISMGGRDVASGRIAEVASVIDPNGTARVVAGITGGTIPAPGTGVELHVQLAERKDVITVPEEAIVAGADGPAVFVSGLADAVFRQYRVKRVPVQLGGRAGGRVEIVSGLRDGERVVVSGADALSDDVPVTEAGEQK